jgi:stress-induced morphogen
VNETGNTLAMLAEDLVSQFRQLCDYKVWIDTKRGATTKCHLRNMVELNMMEEEFRGCRMVGRKRAAYFAMKREMAREEYKKKREEERAQKHEKAQRAKEVYAKGGERVLMKAKWPRLTQD